MKSSELPSAAAPAFGRAAGGLLLALGAVLLALFARSFAPGQILFSSDGPLGANAAAYAAMPGAFRGMWQDLNWVGGQAGSAFPSLTYLLLWALGPLGFAKLYAPVSLLVLGFSAWWFARQLGFRPAVCGLTGLAAALNSDFFSYACWGLGTHALAVASTFLALAALVAPGRTWCRAVLAGAAVGMAVMEGFDSGAILSLYVAAFSFFTAWQAPGPAGRRFWGGALQTALVAGMAAWVAAQALTILVGTQVKGVVGMQQDAETRQRRWNEATMWSLPKIETLRTVVPGLFGYRMYTRDGSDYWGRVGETPGVPGTRHSGAGHYAGLLVVLLGAWALAQAARRQGGPFTVHERQQVWFWGGAALVSLLLAWGRHAPFYQFFYALPYFSTIRNPIKFLHPFSLALVVLFAYGLEALGRTQVSRASPAVRGLGTRFKAWATAAPVLDRRSLLAAAWLLGGSVLGWLVYASMRSALEAHLARVYTPELAPAIAAFSLREVGWSVLFLTLCVAALTLVFLGVFSGARARWAWGVLGVILVADLARANHRWIVYWDVADKYALNPLLETLRQRPHEQRASIIPLRLNPELTLLQDLYRAEWLQHAFRYYNIQSLDVVQDPRPSVDNELYRATFMGQSLAAYLRLWELTNTRYLLGLSGLAEALNQQIDPERRRFREALPFGLVQETAGGAIRVVTNTTGPFALIEFTGALPRAGVYQHWEVATNDTAALQRLADPAFDPRRTVVLASGSAVSLTPPAGAAPAAPGPVEWVSYAPKRLVLRARAGGPSLLLLNDKFDPHWTVTVDGQPRPLLRANFLMRAVELPPGEHTVEFSFRLPAGPLGISLAGLAVTLGCLARGTLPRRKRRDDAPADPVAAGPAGK